MTDANKSAAELWQEQVAQLLRDVEQLEAAVVRLQGDVSELLRAARYVLDVVDGYPGVMDHLRHAVRVVQQSSGTHEP